VAPNTAIQRTIERLGLTRAEAFSKSTALSADIENPTIFEGEMHAVFPTGESMYDLAKHESVVLPFAVKCSVNCQAAGIVTASRFAGPFELHVLYEFTDLTGADRTSTFSGCGKVEFQLR
jgi:hypothetical protein